jgi:hypothetical protein
MFKKFFLRSGTSSAADIETALADYNIAELESQLANAQRRRTDLLLTGSDAEILAAEDEATKARLPLDRAVAAVAELNRRLIDARKTEARAAVQKRRDEAVAAVEKVIARIGNEYATHARAIAEIVEEAEAADTNARSFNRDMFQGEEFEGVEQVRLVHESLGWHKKFLSRRILRAEFRCRRAGLFQASGMLQDGSLARRLTPFTVLAIPTTSRKRHREV